MSTGWTRFQQGGFDLCILDVMMPKKDGFTLAKAIREIDERIPLVFLTAKSMQSDKIEGFRLGADDYIGKPFSIEELLLRVQAKDQPPGIAIVCSSIVLSERGK